MKFSLEWSMDDHTKDSKKSPTYKFWLLVTGICTLSTQNERNMVRSSPPVLSIRLWISKLDEEKLNHIGLAEETGFGLALHLLLIGSIG